MGTHWIIVQGERWRGLRVSGQRVEAFEVEGVGTAAEIAKTLRSRGYRGEGMLLGIESPRCLTSTVEPQLEEVRSDRRALALAIEGGLPWSAEEYVADFLHDGSQMMGVAVQWGDVATLIAELEAVGVWVQSIAPWSLVRVQQLVREQPMRANDFVLLSEEGEAVSLLSMREGVPAMWEWVPAGEGEQLRQRMGLLECRAGSEESRWWCVGLAEERAEQVREWVGEDRLQIVGSNNGLGCDQAGRILTGRERAWVEWRQGPLEDRQPYRSLKTMLRVAAVLGLLAVGLLVAGIRARAGRYEAQAKKLNDEQAKLFRELMPGQKIPIGVRKRLESELVRLKAERGEAAGEAQLSDATQTLECGLTALPSAVRMRVKSIEVDGDQIVWDCEVRTLADSATLVDAITEGGLEVTAPRTEVVNGIVPLKLTATRHKPLLTEVLPTPKGMP